MLVQTLFGRNKNLLKGSEFFTWLEHVQKVKNLVIIIKCDHLRTLSVVPNILSWTFLNSHQFVAFMIQNFIAKSIVLFPKTEVGSTKPLNLKNNFCNKLLNKLKLFLCLTTNLNFPNQSFLPPFSSLGKLLQLCW